MFDWEHGDLKWQTQLGVYAPTGKYQLNQVANIGKNNRAQRISPQSPGAAPDFGLSRR